MINRLILLKTLVFSLISCSNVGEKLPQFELKTLDGKSINQNDLQGKVTVINVWATWCGNCRNELPQLNQLASEYQENDAVIFLALADESPEKLKAFLQQHPFNFVQIPDGTALTDILKTRFVKTYPQHIILDKNLNITYEYSGELFDAVAVLNQEITRNLLQ